MTEPKLIVDGPRKGGYRTICVNCGHFEYKDGPQTQVRPNPSQVPAQKPSVSTQTGQVKVGPPKKPVIFTGS